MKLLILLSFINILSLPAISGDLKKFKEKDFEQIKIMKIEFLNKRINCVKGSQNFRELKKCWKRKKKY